MTGILKPVTALLMATAIVMAGHGVLVMLVPLKASAYEFSSLSVGLMGSGYFAGLVIGCIFAPAVISKVGHIRAFSAFTACVTVTPLAHTLLADPVSWTALRFLQGLCCAGLWLVIESWLNAASDTGTRGRVLGAYTLIQLTLQTVGMQLVGVVDIDGTALFAVAAILYSLSALPIALTGTIAPAPPKRNELRLAWLFRVSPAATLAAGLTGFATGSFWILAPLYAKSAGLSSAGSAGFVAAALLAGAVTQWPIGSLSDRYGRRPAMSAAATVAMRAGRVLNLLRSDFLLSNNRCGTTVQGFINKIMTIGNVACYGNKDTARFDVLGSVMDRTNFRVRQLNIRHGVMDNASIFFIDLSLREVNPDWFDEFQQL